MKTETKFTPGPWHRNIRAGGKYSTVFAGRNTHIAHVCQQPTPEETEANIDLVYAAPSLYEALKRLIKATDEYYRKEPSPETVADKCVELILAEEAARAALALVEKGGGCE